MTRSFSARTAALAIILAAALALPAASHAQRGRSGTPQPVLPPDQTDFDAWNTAKDPVKKVRLGEKFVATYPESKYSEIVYENLVMSYYKQQDWNNFYGDADKAIAKSPDDLNILTLVGWVIPHQYNPDDADAGKKLEKAATYEKHAIDLVSSMTKPGTLTDEQFAAGKRQLLTQAHSGLGLVYFRNQDYDNSVKELQQATEMADAPDATDVYVLGVCLDRLSRYSDAADAFQKCSVIPGPLQDRCKQSVDQDKAQAASQSK